jgi:hypothetical protein
LDSDQLPPIWFKTLVRVAVTALMTFPFPP